MCELQDETSVPFSLADACLLSSIYELGCLAGAIFALMMGCVLV